MACILIVLSVVVLATCSQADDAVPPAQTGSLYPFIRATADGSELPLALSPPATAT